MNTWLKVLIVSLGCLVISQQAQAKENLKTLIQSARKAKSNGKYLKAAKLLFKAYEINKNPILLNNMGKMYEEAGYYREAYDAYRNVADDPNAPNDLRPMNISRMTAMEGKLTKAHLRIKNADNIEVIDVGDERITSDTFKIERSLSTGKRVVFFSPKKSSNLFIDWLNLTAGRRTVVNIAKIKKNASAKLVAFNLRGLETLRVNGTELAHEDLNAIYLSAGIHLVSLGFNDGSEYERTFRMKNNSTYSCDDFATTFNQTKAPVERVSRTHLWLKGGAVALGVGLTTAGGLMALDAKDRHDQILSDPTISMKDARDDWNNAQERGDRGVSIMSVGLTALTSGILWLALDAGKQDGRGAWDWLPRPFTMPNYAVDPLPSNTPQARSTP